MHRPLAPLPFDYTTALPFDQKSMGKRLESLISHLESADVSVPPSSRLRKYQHAIANSPASLTPAERIGITIEYDDITFIVENLCTPAYADAWTPKIAELVSGAAARSSEVAHSRVRDIQFELVTAALFARAGYRITPEEPDIVVRSGSATFAVAAKRPRSERKLYRNIRNAVAQIARSNHEGLVALDFTCLINPKDIPILTPRFSDAQSVVTSTLHQYFTSRWPELETALSASAIGLFIHLSAPVIVVERASSAAEPAIVPAIRGVGFGSARRWVTIDLNRNERQSAVVLQLLKNLELAERRAAG